MSLSMERKMKKKHKKTTTTKKKKKKKESISIRESPSNSPFMKINGNETPKVPNPINFQEWTDERTISDLKYT